MNVRLIATAVAVMFVASCSPKFTVYLGMTERMNTQGVTFIAIDTVKVSDYPQKRIKYVLNRDLGKLERLFLAGKIKRAKKDVDKISK